MSGLPAQPVADGLKLFVRLTPKAARNRIDGIVPDADGTLRLKAAVTAPPEKGKANAALIAVLAKALQLPKGAFSISAGQQSRSKTVMISGDGPDLSTRLEAFIEANRLNED